MKKTEQKQNVLEKIFENGLWSMRFLVLFAVVCSLLSSLILFIIGSLDVFKALKLFVNYYVRHIEVAHFHELIMGKIIGSIDLYLIAVVLLIFSFGIYELFISQIDVAKEHESSSILEVKSLDELKNKITKVIIMVLVVSFFQRVLTMDYNTPLEMLYFSASIFALSFGLYFLHKHNS